MSKLEAFIKNNRPDFDDEVPSEKIWEKIETAFEKKTASHFMLTPLYKWSIAAAMLVVAIGIYFFNREKTPETIANNKLPTDIDMLAPEAAPQMNQFVKMIDDKQEELKILSKEQPELYQTFTKDITQLDSSYHALKTQLSITPNKEMLVEAMIQNLQLQLNVLNQQLSIIKQIKQSKKNSHEKDKRFI